MAPPLRFVHATDQHITPRNNAALGWATALLQINRLSPAPDFLVCGGDCIGDALEVADRAKVERQWDLYDQVMAEHNRLPVRAVMGNHDIWGWLAKDMDETVAGYGKAMALDRLRLKQPYYSFDHSGWHFVVLDNVQREPGTYFGGLDAAQNDWLIADLATNTKPTCVFSHIPLMSITPFNVKGFVKADHYRIPDTWVHRDVMPLIELLRAHHVKLCVGGHLHMVDRVDFLAISFVCNGSICGRWWGGPYAQFPEGYGVFDLFADGSFKHEYVAYGWDAAKHQTPK